MSYFSIIKTKYKLVEEVGGGSVINSATFFFFLLSSVSVCILKCRLQYRINSILQKQLYINIFIFIYRYKKEVLVYAKHAMLKFHSEILASINFNKNKMLSPGLENNHTLKCFLPILQHNNICQDCWKNTRLIFECKVIFQSRGQSPDSC